MRILKSFLLLMAGSSIAATSYGALLIRVDRTDLSNVVFTAVSNNAEATVAGDWHYNNGFNLNNFFTGTPSLGQTSAVSGDFSMPLDGGGSETGFEVNNGFDNGGLVGLNFFVSNSFVNNGITFGEVPISGSIVFDLSAQASVFPSIGATDDIQGGGNTGLVGAVFGQYQVVPEPHQWAMIAAMFSVAIAGAHRRYKRKTMHLTT